MWYMTSLEKLDLEDRISVSIEKKYHDRIPEFFWHIFKDIIESLSFHIKIMKRWLTIAYKCVLEAF